MELEIIISAEKQYDEDCLNVKDLNELENLRLKYLGKKGLVADIMAKFREVPVEMKKEFGQKVNALKNKIETSIEEIKSALAQKAIDLEIQNTKEFDDEYFSGIESTRFRLPDDRRSCYRKETCHRKSGILLRI